MSSPYGTISNPFMSPNFEDHICFPSFEENRGYLSPAKPIYDSNPLLGFFEPQYQQNLQNEHFFNDFNPMLSDADNTIPQNAIGFETEEMKRNFEETDENNWFGCQQELPQEPFFECSQNGTGVDFQMDYTSMREKEKIANSFKSLANRNLKSNFGTGFIQFLEFKKDLAEGKKRKKDVSFYENLLNFVRSKVNCFVSFSGWKELFRDKTHGLSLKKQAKEFFGKSFARTYVQFGKIKEEYKPIYYQKIKCFYEGCKNPELLNPANYNKY